MMGPIVCHRHGYDHVRTTSTGVAARIATRGEFAAGELVAVSLDRPKYSREMWMLRAEVDVHAVDARVVDNVAHVSAFPQIAALERLRAFVCSTCLDELLVRSGEPPYRPTTPEQAFDTSVVAANAKRPANFARCELHGLILPTRTSPLIEEAILSIDVIRDCHVVQVIDGTVKHERRHWFDEAFLRNVLGSDVALEGSTLRLDDNAQVLKLSNAGELVCRTCLQDVLKRSGLSDSSGLSDLSDLSDDDDANDTPKPLKF